MRDDGRVPNKIGEHEALNRAEIFVVEHELSNLILANGLHVVRWGVIGGRGIAWCGTGLG